MCVCVYVCERERVWSLNLLGAHIGDRLVVGAAVASVDGAVAGLDAVPTYTTHFTQSPHLSCGCRA